MRSGEGSVTGKDHDIMFAHPVGQPVRQGRLPQVVELALLINTGPTQNLLEVRAEIVDDLQAGIRDRPATLLSQFLNAIIPPWRYEHIRVPLGLLGLVFSKEKDELFVQGKNAAIGVFDVPFPCGVSVLLWLDFDGHGREINVAPNGIQKFTSPHCRRESTQNQQVSTRKTPSSL